jgi:SAM-dependent methyltransferase
MSIFTRLQNLRRDPWTILRNYRHGIVNLVITASKPWLVPLVRRFNARVRRMSTRTHRWQYLLEWRYDPTPEWFDHHVGVQGLGDEQGHTIDHERGVFTSLAIPRGGRVLDLCCGDGYYARHFYMHRADNVIGVDYNPDVIEYARSVNDAPGISYEVADIRKALPPGPFDTVVWNAAIEHFTEEELADIIAGIRDVLIDGGVLTGDTIVSRPDGKQLVHHEREFSGTEDLLELLQRHFAHASVMDSPFRDRTELYFYASDDESAIPFAPAWGRIARSG